MLFILSNVRNVFFSASPTLKLRQSRAKRGEEKTATDMTIPMRVWLWVRPTVICFPLKILNSNILKFFALLLDV